MINLTKKVKVLTCAGLLTLLLFSCNHYDNLEKNPKESTSNGRSHNAGENCSSCHNNNANPNDYWWTIAGTAFQSNGGAQTAATIELWEKPNRQGRLIKSLKSDTKGNFYTNQVINFNGGLYPSITVGSNYKSMDTTAYTGTSCNSCHGISRSKLTID